MSGYHSIGTITKALSVPHPPGRVLFHSIDWPPDASCSHSMSIEEKSQAALPHTSVEIAPADQSARYARSTDVASNASIRTTSSVSDRMSITSRSTVSMRPSSPDGSTLHSSSADGPYGHRSWTHEIKAGSPSNRESLKSVGIDKVIAKSCNTIRVVQMDDHMAVRKDYESPASVNDILISKFLESMDYSNAMYTVPCIDAGLSAETGGLYMVQPYFRHGNSLEFLSMLPDTARQCMLPKLIKRALQCMAFVHSRGVIHGDIKPSNWFVDNNGNVVLSDFELSIMNTKDNKPIGTNRYTPAYRAPEIIKGDICYASDIWALGMTFYVWSRGYSLLDIADAGAMGTSHPKYMLDVIQFSLKNNDLNKHLPIDNLISMMINMEPSKRPSAQELLNYFIKNIERNPMGVIGVMAPPEPTLLSIECNIGMSLMPYDDMAIADIHAGMDCDDDSEDGKCDTSSMISSVTRYVTGTNMSEDEVSEMIDFLNKTSYDIMTA